MTVFSHDHNINNPFDGQMRLPPAVCPAADGSATYLPFATTFLHFVPLVSLFYPTQDKSARGKYRKIQVFPLSFCELFRIPVGKKRRKNRHIWRLCSCVTHIWRIFLTVFYHRGCPVGDQPIFLFISGIFLHCGGISCFWIRFPFPKFLLHCHFPPPCGPGCGI